MGPGPGDIGSSRHHLIEACRAFAGSAPTTSTISSTARAHRSRPCARSTTWLRGQDPLHRLPNFSGWHLMKSARGVRPVRARALRRPQYSLIGRDYEWELMPLALNQDVGTVVWSPLGWGRLTGKIRRNQPLPATSRLHVTAKNGPPVDDEYLYRVVDAIDGIAKETGKSVPQIALNWLLQRPTVANVIIGARNEEQLRDNLGAVGWNLTAAQVARLEAASATTLPYPYWHQRFEYSDRNPPPV